MCRLIYEEKLPRPDVIVIADTGREKPSTFEYLAELVQPMMQSIGLEVQIAERRHAYVDLYAHNGDLLLPVYTPTGKLPAFCSSEWKKHVVRRHLREQGITGGINWIGYAIDESKRYKPTLEDVRGPWYRRFPLFELNLTKADCRAIIQRAGMPMPPPSSCWMCPNLRDEEWRYVRDNYPDAWQKAIQLDVELRDEDLARGNKGVWLHRSRKPLSEVDLDAEDDGSDESRQCGLGMCFI